jgi:EmrB/QacA subfamily drug resistance transporter
MAEQRPVVRSERAAQWVFLGLMLASLMGTLDTSIVATALPTIVGDLGGLDHIGWVGSAYLLTVAVSMPLLGKLGDQLDRRRVFLFSLAAFSVASAASGAAQGLGQLIAFRALQGIGGGGLLVSGFAMVADLFEPRARARYQGYSAGVWAISSVAGPLAGGLLTEHLGWRSVFLVNLPLGVASWLLVTTFLPRRRVEGRPEIDYLGAVLLSAAVAGLVLVTSWGGRDYGWTSWPIVLLCLGTAGFLLAWIRQARAAREPVLPLGLFQDRTFTVCAVLAFVAGFVMLAFVTFLPLFLQIVNDVSVVKSGLLLIPMMFGLVLGAAGSGIAISRSGSYRWYPVASMVLIGVGATLLSTMSTDTPRLVSSAYMAVLGIGAGLSQQVLVLAVQNTIPARDRGAATAAVTFLRLAGSAVGVAVFGAVLAARLAVELPRAGAPDVGAGGLLDPSSVLGLPGAARDAVAQAFAHSLHVVFLVALPVVLVGLVASLLLPEVPLAENPFAHGAEARGTEESAGAPSAGRGGPGGRAAQPRAGDEAQGAG